MSLRINMFALPLLAGVALIVGSPGAQAQVTNGTFANNGGAGQLTVNTTLANWTGGGKEGAFGSQTTPPVFVFSPGTTTQLSGTGVNGDAFMGNVKFYSTTAAPDGGVVIAADGDPAWAGSISQTVGGLTAGQAYNLTFNWAGAQQQGFSGNTTEDWQVNFGASTQTTATVNTPSQTFVGWQTASMTFTPTAASELLSFVAKGSPSGEPPWLLIDDVSLTAAASPSTPEPGAIALVSGLGLAGAVYLRRRRK